MILNIFKIIPTSKTSSVVRRSIPWANSDIPITEFSRIQTQMSRLMTKPTKLHVRPAKTQISLGIRPVWSVSSLSAWRKLPIQRTAKTLIRLGGHAGHTCHFVGFVMRWLKFHMSCTVTKPVYAVSRNNKDAIQPAHLSSLNSDFIVRFPDSIMSHLLRVVTPAGLEPGQIVPPPSSE